MRVAYSGTTAVTVAIRGALPSTISRQKLSSHGRREPGRDRALRGGAQDDLAVVDDPGDHPDVPADVLVQELEQPVDGGGPVAPRRHIRDPGWNHAVRFSPFERAQSRTRRGVCEVFSGCRRDPSSSRCSGLVLGLFLGLGLHHVGLAARPRRRRRRATPRRPARPGRAAPRPSPSPCRRCSCRHPSAGQRPVLLGRPPRRDAPGPVSLRRRAAARRPPRPVTAAARGRGSRCRRRGTSRR